MLFITSSRRKRLKSQPFPPAWVQLLERRVPLYERLPEADREELKGHILVFLAEKNFEGCGGFTMSDEVRLTIAAQACILLLHRESDYFPGLSSILVYPGEYVAPFVEMDESGVVTERFDRRLGESSQQGAIVLSWEDVCPEGPGVHGAYNVVLHEFAHQLDTEDGVTTGEPLLPKRFRKRLLTGILVQEHQRFRDEVAAGRPMPFDPYGAESLEEFFAVATECFFEQPQSLLESCPALYAELATYFRQDPAAWGGSD